MPQDKINFIREKCVMANPEICEADKGFRNLAKTGWQYAYLDKNGRNQHSEKVFKTQKEAYEAALISGRFPIRTIRLADILQTIKGNSVAIDTFGEFMIWQTLDNMHVGQNVYWDLFRDNLNDQSEETINFIYSLLQ